MGSRPGAALPTATCQSIFAVAVAVKGGRGPIFLLENQSNEGTGIDGIQDDNPAQPESASSESIAAAARSRDEFIRTRFTSAARLGRERRRAQRCRSAPSPVQQLPVSLCSRLCRLSPSPVQQFRSERLPGRPCHRRYWPAPP